MSDGQLNSTADSSNKLCIHYYKLHIQIFTDFLKNA